MARLGLTSTGFSVAPDFLESADWVVYRTVVIDSNAQDAGNTEDPKHLRPGLVLGKIDASGKWTAYDNTVTGGPDTARGILAHEVQLDGTNDADAVVVIAGVVREAKLIGLDAAAKTDLTNAANGALILFV